MYHVMEILPQNVACLCISSLDCVFDVQLTLAGIPGPRDSDFRMPIFAMEWQKQRHDVTRPADKIRAMEDLWFA
jgi:hypothetical protein